MIISAVSRHTFKHSDYLIAITFSPNGQLVATASHNEVRLWHLASGALRRDIEGAQNWVESLSFSRDGELLVFASNENRKPWDATAASLPRAVEDCSTPAKILSVSSDAHADELPIGGKVHRLHQSEVRQDVWICHTQGPIESLSFSQDGKYLMSDRVVLNLSPLDTPFQQRRSIIPPELEVKEQWVAWKHADVLWIHRNDQSPPS